MSIKNQSRLFIFALMIIGGTVFSLVGLNYLVDGISKKKPVEMAHQQPPSPPRNMNGKDDELAPPEVPEPLNPQNNGPEMPPGRRQFPDMNRMMPPQGMGNMGNNGQGVMRRMPKGNHDIERTPPPMDRGDRNNGNGNGAPGKMPQRDPREPMGYPPPGNFRPSDEEIRQMEMERRRMMESYPPGPPPDYYNRDDRYDGPYDGPPDDYYDDYDPGYEGKLEDHGKEDIRTSHTVDSGDLRDDSLEDPDFQLDDEYLYEFLDEDEDQD